MPGNNKIDPGQLGFDFDGVIADIAEAFIRLACDDHNICGLKMEDITSFEVDKCLDVNEEIVEAIFLSILKDSVGTGMLPMPGSVDVITEFADLADLTVITARPFGGPVYDWLQTVLPESTLPKISVVAMGDHDDKLRYIREHNIRYFIDDRIDTCLQLHEAGIGSFVFSQPWNRNGHQLPTVNSWQEIRALCI